MKLKSLLFGGCIIAGTLLTCSFSANATGSNIGILIGSDDPLTLNSQELAAVNWLGETYPDAVLITPSTLSKIDSSTLDAIWVNIDRIGLTGVPAEFSGAYGSLAQFVKDGGNLYLSKHATLMLPGIGRIPDNQKPNIVSNGDGGNGTDVWNVNAYIGSWQINPDNGEQDPTQIYDRRSHAIYKDLTEFAPYSEWNNCPHPAFPLEGTGNGTEMWREDHNCLWDLNAVTFTADGKNTVEKYEAQNDCVILGTWGHVQDYAVAGIIEFNPSGEYTGKIIANGLAAYEWAPRNGVNAYHSNIQKLTANTLSYLAPERQGNSGIADLEAETAGKVEYYTIQGAKVLNPRNGIFIKLENGKASKVVL